MKPHKKKKNPFTRKPHLIYQPLKRHSKEIPLFSDNFTQTSPLNSTRARGRKTGRFRFEKFAGGLRDRPRPRRRGRKCALPAALNFSCSRASSCSAVFPAVIRNYFLLNNSRPGSFRLVNHCTRCVDSGGIRVTSSPFLGIR